VTTEYLAWILASGLATGIGGLALLAFRSPTARLLDALLGFTAGVMLAATAFSLLVPALDLGGIGEVLIGLVVGFCAIAVLDVAIPHAHARFRERGRLAAEEREASERGALLLAALTIHNIPEGAAVGVAFAAGGTELGIPLALAIGIQNIPEGFAAAAPLIGAGTAPHRAAGIAALTGTVEPPAALAAFAAFELASGLLPGGLAFAAGAMLYVIVDELIPEAFGRGNERLAATGFLLGFALMMTLDNAFG
jgi:zinc transporter, ZIP family